VARGIPGWKRCVAEREVEAENEKEGGQEREGKEGEARSGSGKRWKLRRSW
jgi:hypothetical protein